MDPDDVHLAIKPSRLSPVDVLLRGPQRSGYQAVSTGAGGGGGGRRLRRQCSVSSWPLLALACCLAVLLLLLAFLWAWLPLAHSVPDDAALDAAFDIPRLAQLAVQARPSYAGADSSADPWGPVEVSTVCSPKNPGRGVLWDSARPWP
jgi:hypothetical protein